MTPRTSRRTFLRGTCAAAAGVAAAAPRPGLAQPAGPGLTPDEALALLKTGNQEFLDGTRATESVSAERRMEIARGQTPLAVVVTCSDSRVTPALLFNRGLGELFTIRNAGNTVDTAALGSIEYGVLALGVPLVVILGHERCGAVEAAVSVFEQDTAYPDAMGEMIQPIIPAVLAARADGGDLLEASIRRNVLRTVDRLRDEEALLNEPIAAGRLRVVGARYDLEDGTVDFFDEAPGEEG